jgi:hypothetical protein
MVTWLKTLLPSGSRPRMQRPRVPLARLSLNCAPGASRSRHASQSDDRTAPKSRASSFPQSVRNGGAGGGDGDGGGDGGGGDGGVDGGPAGGALGGTPGGGGDGGGTFGGSDGGVLGGVLGGAIGGVLGGGLGGALGGADGGALGGVLGGALGGADGGGQGGVLGGVLGGAAGGVDGGGGGCGAQHAVVPAACCITKYMGESLVHCSTPLILKGVAHAGHGHGVPLGMHAPSAAGQQYVPPPQRPMHESCSRAVLHSAAHRGKVNGSRLSSFSRQNLMGSSRAMSGLLPQPPLS